MANRITDHFSKDFSVDFISNTMKNTACQFHQTYELCFFSSGHRTYMINDDIYDITPNTVIVIPPYTRHSTCGTTAATRTVVYFTENFLKQYFSTAFIQELLNGFSMPFFVFSQPRENISSLIENIRDCHFQNKKSNTALYLAMVLNSIKTLQPLPRKEKEDATQGIVARTISFVENNLTSLDSLKEIANSFHISLSYLEATFRKNTGISLMQYIIKSKINYAMKQLISTQDSISEIAQACGFNSSTHFSNTFKKHTGLSPREYRQRY